MCLSIRASAQACCQPPAPHVVEHADHEDQTPSQSLLLDALISMIVLVVVSTELVVANVFVLEVVALVLLVVAVPVLVSAVSVAVVVALVVIEVEVIAVLTLEVAMTTLSLVLPPPVVHLSSPTS